MEPQVLYRLRRRSDGKWYGNKAHHSGKDGQWRPRAGKFLTLKALQTVLRGRRAEDWFDVDIVEYAIQEVRDRPATRLTKNQATCGACGDIIVSQDRHDFVRCSCGKAFVDGGLSYLRRGGTAKDCSEYSAGLPLEPYTGDIRKGLRLVWLQPCRTRTGFVIPEGSKLRVLQAVTDPYDDGEDGWMVEAANGTTAWTSLDGCIERGLLAEDKT
jgi:hypothetical protein